MVNNHFNRLIEAMNNNSNNNQEVEVVRSFKELLDYLFMIKDHHVQDNYSKYQRKIQKSIIKVSLKM